MKKILSTCLLAVASLSATAQDWTTEMRSMRPEIYYGDEATSAEGPRKMKRAASSQANAPMKSIGSPKIPIILVNFADKVFTVGNTDEEIRAYYELYFNGTRDGKLYKEHGSYGAVRDYFAQQSDSLFLPEFVIIGPVTVPQGYAYYGANSGAKKDVNASVFYRDVYEAALKVHEDWSEFDNNGDGTIDIATFIYAGPGENTSGVPSQLYPKENFNSITINGKVFATSGLVSELRVQADYSAVPDGVGVFCHEMSHTLGLPDFYDTGYIAPGMDMWDLMDYGEYGVNGFIPCGYTAYEREYMGWQSLVELTEPQIVTAKCFHDGGCGYKITNPNNKNEYFVLENRQRKGWDCGVCAYGHGLQITHVDYEASRWANNAVNTDRNHQRMTVVWANNLYKGLNAASSAAEWVEWLDGTLYPGSTLNYNFTDESAPASTVYTGGVIRQPVRNITENKDGTVTFCFRTNGKLDAPQVLDAQDIETTSFTARWEMVENAVEYEIELYKGEEKETTQTIDADLLLAGEYLFEDMVVSTAYKYRVRAHAESPEDYLSSDWSDFSYLNTLADRIDLAKDSERMVDVYNMNGMLVRHCYADEVRNSFNLRSGVYILRYQDGTTRKVLF